MKQLILSLALLFAVGCWCAPQVMAKGDDAISSVEKKKKKKAKRGALSPVAQALEEAGYFTETEARPKAKFYIFICSASWCGPCRALMPKVVEEYETKMKKNKSVSMVLLGCDSDDESARQYIEHYETDMPGVLNKKVNLENRPEIPGIPWYFILNAKGELVSVGAGSKVLDWEAEIKKKPAKPEKASKKKSRR
ncbi:MAG: redoxin family protein [Akkermansia sp.]|nr:redoxin family protein [Akkermansia sp.]